MQKIWKAVVVVPEPCQCNKVQWGVLGVFCEMSAWWGMSTSRRPYFVHIDSYTSILPSLNCKVPKRIKKKRRDTWSFGHYIFPIFPDGSFTQRLPWCIGCIWPKAEPFESLRNSSFKLAKLWLQKSEKKLYSTRFLTNEPHLSWSFCDCLYCFFLQFHVSLSKVCATKDAFKRLWTCWDFRGAQPTQPTTQPTSTPQPIPPANSAGYHSSRAEAVQSVQKTIGELAQMFQKFLGRDAFFWGADQPDQKKETRNTTRKIRG